MISDSKKMPTSVRAARTILHVISVPEISYKFSQPRVTREIDAMLETDRYVPVVVSTEKVLIHEIMRPHRDKSFEDSRVKIYRVPNLIEKPLQFYCQNNLVNKIFYLIFNGLSQLLYFFLMVPTLLVATIKEKALLIHVHNPPDLAGMAALAVSKLTGIPYVFEIHDSTPVLYRENMGLSTDSLVYSILRLMERIVVTKSAALVTVSNSMLSSFYDDVDVPKIVIYSGWSSQMTKLSAARESNLRSKYGLENKSILLYVGKLFSQIYDLQLSLQALFCIVRKHTDTIMVYVGEGEDRTILESLAREMHLEANVLFVGQIPRSEAYDWIRASDVTFLTLRASLQTKVAVPNKLLEYMAFGKPIVTANLPGVSEVIRNGENGLLYLPGSVEDFAKCVISLIEDSVLKNTLGNNAKRDFESSYCSEKNMPKLISLYDSIKGCYC
jgi:glycosyltransferase involved in cell wall biosynthesis